MEVIYYQALIIVTILVARAFTRTASVIACLLWSVFTAFNVFYPPLILIQLVVVWGTYLLSSAFSSQTTEINDLKKSLTSLSPTQKRIVSPLTNDCFSLIRGIQHRDYLLSGISAAERRVIIVSGWISEWGADDRFFARLEGSLARNVSVWIGYGWKSSAGTHDPHDAGRAIQRLNAPQLRYPARLTVNEFATHEKIFICDNITVIGSANWLSNRSYQNAESSIAINSKALADLESSRLYGR